jgi:hypothetical protein
MTITSFLFYRLLDSTFTLEEVEDVLNDISNEVTTEVESELVSTLINFYSSSLTKKPVAYSMSILQS